MQSRERDYTILRKIADDGISHLLLRPHEVWKSIQFHTLHSVLCASKVLEHFTRAIASQ